MPRLLALLAMLLPSFMLCAQSAILHKPPGVVHLKDRPQPRVISAGAPVVTHANDPVVNFTVFGTEEGLPMSSVDCGLVDAQGYLWFGTSGAGVTRYDGRRFRTYTIHEGLAHNGVRAMVEDKQGRLWFGTDGGGISLWDGRSFRTVSVDQGLSSNTITCLLVDSNNAVWAAGFGTTLSRIEADSIAAIALPDELAEYYVIEDMALDAEGRIWMGTDGLGAWVYDGKEYTSLSQADGLANDVVWIVYPADDGSVWLGTEKGLSRWDGKEFHNFSEVEGLAGAEISTIIEDQKGDIWVGTVNDGLFRFDGVQFTDFSKRSGLSHNHVSCLVEDRSGFLWVGTQGGGLNRYEGPTFVSYSSEQGLGVTMTLWAVFQDDEGNIWMGTEGAGLVRYDGREYHRWGPEQGLDEPDIMGITQDSSGVLWLAGWNSGLTRFDGKTFTTYTLEQGLIDPTIWNLMIDRDGIIWMGTYFGLSRFDGNSFTNYSEDQGLPPNTIQTLAQDQQGNIWLGTDGQGVFRFDGTRFQGFKTEDGLADNSVLSLLVDRSGTLWAGTYGGGLSRFDGSSFLSYTSEDGLPNDVVYDLTEDEDGCLWIGSNLGLARLDYSKGTDAIHSACALSVDNQTLEKEYSPVWEAFNQKTGYRIKDINMNAMHLSPRDLPYGEFPNAGHIWAGTGDERLIQFDPHARQPKYSAPQVVIQQIQINQEDVCWPCLLPGMKGETLDSALLREQEIFTYGEPLTGDRRNRLTGLFEGITFDELEGTYGLPVVLELPYQNNHITFDFNGLETARNFLVRYQCWLVGEEDSWGPASRKTSVTYSNLYEGQYTLMVRAQSPDGAWGESAVFSFCILPPWWRTWWMYALYIVGFIALVWLLVRLNVRRLRRRAWLLAEQVAAATGEIRVQKEELESTLARLQEAQSQLVQSEKMASVGMLAAGIAHEINNPLNFIHGGNYALAEYIRTNAEEHASELEPLIEIIDEGVNRTSAIVKSLNRFNRQSEDDKEDCDFHAIIDSCLTIIHGQLKHRITIQKEQMQGPAVMKGNEGELHQVILNLLTNAEQAIGESGTIIIRTRMINDRFELEIEDDGHGISPEHLERIMEPFFTTKDPGQGTGLGTSIALSIVQKHGGTLNYQSDGESGTTVLLSFPLVKTQ